MAETEVESILREIRERVLSQQRAGQDVAAKRLALSGGNGAGDAGPVGQMTQQRESETLVAENLSLISSYLTTTARAWDRLPPVVSNRSGLIARVELWLKRHLKRATRWYAWEQVNFNAAVHHALRDLLPVLLAQDAELRKLRAQLAEAAAEAVAEAEASRTGLTAQLAGVDVQLAGVDVQLAGVDVQLAGLTNELRERDAHLRDEQRVCFKQLALETTEAAVLEDRARRQTEALLEELQRRVGRLEKKTEA